MTKIISYAYRPGGTSESRRIEMEELRRSFPLIVRNLDHILKTPRLFFCQLQSAYTWAFWIGPSGPVPLGVLALLWQQGKMIFDCPECGGRFYALGVGGSFSSSEVWGLCADCNYDGKFSCFPGWLQNYSEVAKLLPFYKNEPVIEYGKRPRFDWKYGLVGETTPDKIVVPAVEPASLTTLLAELEVAEAGAVIPDEGTERVQPCRFEAPGVFLQLQKGQGVLKLPLSLENHEENHADAEGNGPEDPRDMEKIL